MIESYGIVEIVVGHPVHMRSGEPSESSQKAERLAAELHERYSIPVELWDERLSSREARRVLQGARAEKGAVDKLSAVLILQGYLEFRSNQE